MKMLLYVDNLDIRLKVRSSFYFIWDYDNLDMHDSVYLNYRSFPGCGIVLVITYGDSTVLTSIAELRRRD